MVPPGGQQGSRSGNPRLGLALSGGGFRAAFFHLGVLARMAELDLLRQVEVLSTVSGGAVIGTMYYLKVRKLLQERPDDKIQSEDFIQIVSDLEREFYDGVRRNLRTRTFSNPLRNLRMYSRRYSRSDRLAELYTRYLFAPLVECDLLPTIPLAKTIIEPAGEAAKDKRHNKVPVLLLNATTLNTGHNFRFTPTWMGEVPTQGARQEIDQNTRLRRAWFSRDELPEKYEKLPLGIAVAASTAVPGVFHPLALTDLYKEWTPKLLDGGLHDNQGTEGLLDTECTHLIVSDACGQMQDDPNPSTRLISVLSRSNAVMMDRVREEMYETAKRREDAQKGKLVYLHLRHGLTSPELTWIGGTKKKGNEQEVGRKISCGVTKSVQLLLSNVRTDLDSFSEVEAQALMADGYLIAESQIPSSFVANGEYSSQADSQEGSHRWGFLRLAPYLKGEKLDSLFCRQLEIAGARAFKVFMRFRWLCATAGGSGLILAGTLLWHMFFVAPEKYVGFVRTLCECLDSYQTLGHAVLALFAYGTLFLLPRRLRWVATLRDLPLRVGLSAGTVTVATTAAWIHILIFDRLFLWQGRVDRLKGISQD